ncbi:hypothetical protein BCR32DRAFT_282042 [Anaeromyces robustus]|uniref:Uncharacterized protein n=1 Tax=Anaeromyces robustus TaxID=1754192 RepID=A0A1Y1WYQ2_9FUNG|nr:hypothetical protein BCR32DRAFT_282042 [Anaeromyces robustus]|eukprot:ORX78680.1 hypothetical protein BCR32DRAFT_282042 [Anaeromyces robustus]
MSNLLKEEKRKYMNIHCSKGFIIVLNQSVKSTYCDLGLSYVESRSYSSAELTFVGGCKSFDKVINEVGNA